MIYFLMYLVGTELGVWSKGLAAFIKSPPTFPPISVFWFVHFVFYLPNHSNNISIRCIVFLPPLWHIAQLQGCQQLMWVFWQYPFLPPSHTTFVFLQTRTGMLLLLTSGTLVFKNYIILKYNFNKWMEQNFRGKTDLSKVKLWLI